MISACIDQGIVGGGEIVGTLKHLGLNSQFVGIILTKGTGNDPARHFWVKDTSGNYHNHS